ncbi:TPA: protein-export chaperone SecB [Vibrio parahaemolyticus]|nr:protein-export chaperone SecB [Vibrio parahaemolyticus]HCG8049894.1 protein-export chaperone SecB [Vibrio parahaemolyticus]HCG8065304.1 protein-export chaperone SecB [Vibrio parahaemolyticus]HCH0774091.1 protein-export chaperone SecB [Vibrio parahaemolyticus]
MWDLHAIQIDNINFIKTCIEKNPLGEESDHNFSMQCARTEFSDEENTIGVKVTAKIGYDDDQEKIPDAEFWMEIIIEGIFTVDLSRFPRDKIDVWANQNAPLTLYPYVREAAYSLTSRVMKDAAAILPLLTVPTVRTTNK